MPKDQEDQKDRGEITGPYKDGALFVRDLFGSASTRAIATKTGVSYTSVQAMLKGARADWENTFKAARAYGVNPNVLFRLFGHDIFPELDQIDWSLSKSVVREQLVNRTKGRVKTAGAITAKGNVLELPSGRKLQVLWHGGGPGKSVTIAGDVAEILEQLVSATVIQDGATEEGVEGEGDLGEGDDSA